MRILPYIFTLVFDGWTSSSTHYVALLASFPSQNSNGFEMRLLSVSSMGNECQLTAEEHIKYFDYVLSLYSKSLNNACALVGDDAPDNRAIAIRSNIPFVGCASHRLNLAVRDILQHHSEVISKVHPIMLKLRTLLLRAKLLNLTPLCPYLRNETTLELKLFHVGALSKTTRVSSQFAVT